MRLLSVSLVLFCFFRSLLSAHGHWSEGRAEGWAWYEERLRDDREPAEFESDRPSLVLSHIREELEDALARALLDPTEDNVVAYMRMQQIWVERSAQFAGEWARALLQHPTLDYTASHVPTSQYGLQYHNHKLVQEKERVISTLTSDHGLFLFYRGEDPASYSFQRVIGELERKYDWAVLAISVDGTEIGSFGLHRKDNGISEVFGVEVYPALYVVSPEERVATPVSFGLASVDQIEENIFLQFSGGRE